MLLPRSSSPPAFFANDSALSEDAAGISNWHTTTEAVSIKDLALTTSSGVNNPFAPLTIIIEFSPTDNL